MLHVRTHRAFRQTVDHMSEVDTTGLGLPFSVLTRGKPMATLLST
uniref:Uncharacterized protein n=1 Tax=Escherichia coli TaxID=562 RepID=A0A411KX31_ECOLX|nr:hypothetical protein [Escherichia coli]